MAAVHSFYAKGCHGARPERNRWPAGTGTYCLSWSHPATSWNIHGVRSFDWTLCDAFLPHELDRLVGRGPSARIDAVEFLRLRVINKCEQVPAYAAKDRLNNSEYGVSGDDRIDSGTAMLENHGPRSRGERLVCGYDSVGAGHNGPRRATPLGPLLRQCRAQAQKERQGYSTQTSHRVFSLGSG